MRQKLFNPTSVSVYLKKKNIYCVCVWNNILLHWGLGVQRWTRDEILQNHFSCPAFEQGERVKARGGKPVGNQMLPDVSAIWVETEYSK